MGIGVKEVRKSECRSVMEWIGKYPTREGADFGLVFDHNSNLERYERRQANTENSRGEIFSEFVRLRLYGLEFHQLE